MLLGTENSREEPELGTAGDGLKEAARFIFSMIHRGHKIVKTQLQLLQLTGRRRTLKKKKRLNVKGTKKKGCHATLSLKRIELFPDFKVDMPQPCGWIKEQKLKSAKITQLQGSESAVSEKRIYIAIAARTSHTNHGFGDIERFSETMDKCLAEHISLLVREGIISLSDETVRICMYTMCYFLVVENLTAAAEHFSLLLRTSPTTSKLLLEETGLALSTKQMQLI
ncbi:hypothetical protein V5799_014512 [Amblyomma americanum]|uniref:Uncharacterized protein n=1 Tax=Amblyomma americanum TaxID=6943 RepID=A0AAQ4E2T5_AMBAM